MKKIFQKKFTHPLLNNVFLATFLHLNAVKHQKTTLSKPLTSSNAYNFIF
ncbi:hypothetical protein CUPB0001 (plasmid) [Campylobacter upsaliensis RM3195]|nr:hypothetical protein CUPB0001 [Campylobacter upsaliensis RM3195]